MLPPLLLLLLTRCVWPQCWCWRVQRAHLQRSKTQSTLPVLLLLLLCTAAVPGQVRVAPVVVLEGSSVLTHNDVRQLVALNPGCVTDVQWAAHVPPLVSALGREALCEQCVSLSVSLCVGGSGYVGL